MWPNATNPFSPGNWLFEFAFEIVPFALAALLRGTGAIGRLAAALATTIVVALVVIGQYAGLNPDNPSSTAPIALVIMPIWAVFPVVLVWWLGVLARGAREAVRRIRP